MLSKKILDHARAALVLLALTATVFTVVASAAPDSVRRANASRTRQQHSARAKSQAQAKQRAQAQQRQRAQAQQRQRAQAQAQQRQRAQAQSQARQRAKAQAAQRAKAQAAKRAQAQQQQRARAQAQARQRAASKPARKPSTGNQQGQRRNRDANRFKNSLNSGAGSVRPGSRPATRPATEGTDRMTRDRDRHDNGDHLQNGNRRPGSISGATRDALPAGAGRREVDWDSAGDRFDQGGNGDSGRWEGIRDEHDDLDFFGGKYRSETTSEFEASGFMIGGGGGGGYNSGYGYWDDEEPMDWVEDDRPYTPNNNEFYAVDSKVPTTAESMIDPRTGKVIGGGTGEGTSPDTVRETPVPLPGNRVTKLSSKAVLADTSGEALYYDRGVFFRDHQVGKRYEVVTPPVGAIVPKLPKGYRKVTLAGTEYSIYQDVYYKTVYKAGHVVYMVAQVGD